MYTNLTYDVYYSFNGKISEKPQNIFISEINLNERQIEKLIQNKLSYINQLMVFQSKELIYSNDYKIFKGKINFLLNGELTTIESDKTKSFHINMKNKNSIEESIKYIVENLYKLKGEISEIDTKNLLEDLNKYLYISKNGKYFIGTEYDFIDRFKDLEYDRGKDNFVEANDTKYERVEILSENKLTLHTEKVKNLLKKQKEQKCIEKII